MACYSVKFHCYDDLRGERGATLKLKQGFCQGIVGFVAFCPNISVILSLNLFVVNLLDSDQFPPEDGTEGKEGIGSPKEGVLGMAGREHCRVEGAEGVRREEELCCQMGVPKPVDETIRVRKESVG
jgi:hypothetical protein